MKSLHNRIHKQTRVAMFPYRKSYLSHVQFGGPRHTDFLAIDFASADAGSPASGFGLFVWRVGPGCHIHYLIFYRAVTSGLASSNLRFHFIHFLIPLSRAAAALSIATRDGFRVPATRVRLLLLNPFLSGRSVVWSHLPYFPTREDARARRTSIPAQQVFDPRRFNVCASVTHPWFRDMLHGLV
jgi:hypothetical protein